MSIKSKAILKLARTSNITRVVYLKGSVELSIINDDHNSLVRELEKEYPNKGDDDIASKTLNSLISVETNTDNSVELKQKTIYVINEEHWNNYQEDIISDLRTMSLESIDHMVYISGPISLHKEINSTIDNQTHTDISNYLSEPK